MLSLHLTWLVQYSQSIETVYSVLFFKLYSSQDSSNITVEKAFEGSGKALVVFNLLIDLAVSISVLSLYTHVNALL